MNYHQFTIALPDLAKDDLTSRLMEIDCLGTFEENGQLVAYFPEHSDPDLIERAIAAFSSSPEAARSAVPLTVQRTVIPEQDWNAVWKKGFRPTDVGARFTVLPPWEQQKAGRTNVIIDPGMAFGTGHHETTRSCIRIMEDMADRPGKERFLDLGTGTGLLAIAAAHLGFGHIVAVDTDPDAVAAAQRNLDLNRIRNMEVILGGIEHATGSFDCIAANLVSLLLVRLAPAIASRLRPGGIVILSGILTGQETEVFNAMLSSGLHVERAVLDGKWVSLLMCGAS